MSVVDDKNLVPPYIRDLKPYQAGRPIEQVAREKGLTKISKLASNENPLGPTPKALAAMEKAIKETHRYPDMHGFELKTKLAEKYKLKKENIILGNGSEGIMSCIVRAFLQPGEEVLTSEKTFIGFYILGRSVGAKIVMTPMTEDYRYDVDGMISRITDKTKIIYIANPNNPTGTYINRKEFDRLMNNVPDHVLVVLDEAYFELAQDQGDYPDSMDYRYDNVITTRTFSKAYGIAGIRVGYGFGHENLIGNLTKIKLPFEPNLVAQRAAVAALDDHDYLKRALENNNIQGKKLREYLKGKDISPIDSVTNFISFKTGSGEASDWMFESLLNEGVIIRPLKANEMPDFMRVSIGIPEEMDHFYEAFEKIWPEYFKRFGALL